MVGWENEDKDAHQSSASENEILIFRADLVPNLVKTVKGYAKHESKIMKSVTDARKAFLGAKDLKGRVKAGNQLQTALKSIFALAENYPQLKANKNFLHLQQELSAIEDKIAYSRQFYNDSILDYKNSVSFYASDRTSPASLAGLVLSPCVTERESMEWR